MNLKYILFVLFLFLLNNLLFTQAKNNNVKANQFNVEIIAKNNIQTEGNIIFKATKISVKFVKDGFYYKNLIDINNVKSIEFLEWQAKQIGKSKKKPNKSMFYFFPARILFTYKDNQKFIAETRIPQLDVFTLVNQYGQTKIYSYFIDFWITLEDGSGYWHSSGNKDFFHNKINDKTIIKIVFIEEKKKNEEIPNTENKKD